MKKTYFGVSLVLWNENSASLKQKKQKQIEDSIDSILRYLLSCQLSSASPAMSQRIKIWLPTLYFVV